MAYDLSPGSGPGQCGFRLYPTDDFADFDSTVDVRSVGGGYVLDYTWRHAEEGEQSGTIIFGPPAEDGTVTVGWLDSFHQRAAALLSGSSDDQGVAVSYEYAPGWHWVIGLMFAGRSPAMVMRNVVPREVDPDAVPYDVMRATWTLGSGDDGR